MERLAAGFLIERDPDFEWPNADEDATLLVLLVKALADDVHELNRRLDEPRDLCPLCAGHTWGLREDGEEDERECHRCGTRRPVPPEG